MNGISICLATHENRLTNLQMCLFSIQNQDYKGSLEVVIVDDNSETNIVEKTIQDCSLDIKYEKYSCNSYFNFSACRNIAVAKAKYDIILGFDCDMIHDKSLLSTVYQAHIQDFDKNKDYACVVPWRNTQTIIWIDPFQFDSENRATIINPNGVYSDENINLLKHRIVEGTLAEYSHHYRAVPMFVEYSKNNPTIKFTEPKECHKYLSEYEKEGLLLWLPNQPNVFDFDWYSMTTGVCSYWKQFFDGDEPWGRKIGYNKHVSQPKVKGNPRIYVPLVDKAYHIRHSNNYKGRNE